ncbi:hypothetical protein ACLB2K_069511 [Fragaria x ananassa]
MESEDDQLYIPQVKSEVVPKLKQEFETLDEVASFYNIYAKEGGFSTRSYTSKLRKDNTTVTRKEYVCSKQGDSKAEGEKQKLDAIKYRDHYQDFHSCIWNSSSGDEFDSRWNELIEKSGLSDNKWLKSIYEIRSSWIPAHFRRGLLHQRNHELREDHINIEEKIKTAMSLDIEDDMAKIQNVDKLPIQYILKRWTKAARQSVVLDSNGVEIKDNKTFFVRRTKLLQHATYAIDKAIVSDEASQLLMESLDDFLEKFNRLSNGNLAPVLETETPTIQHVFNEPDEVSEPKGVAKG